MYKRHPVFIYGIWSLSMYRMLASSTPERERRGVEHSCVRYRSTLLGKKENLKGFFGCPHRRTFWIKMYVWLHQARIKQGSPIGQPKNPFGTIFSKSVLYEIICWSLSHQEVSHHLGTLYSAFMIRRAMLSQYGPQVHTLSTGHLSSSEKGLMLCLMCSCVFVRASITCRIKNCACYCRIGCRNVRLLYSVYF